MEKETRQMIEDFFAKMQEGSVTKFEFDDFIFDVWQAGRDRGYEDGVDDAQENITKM